MTNPPLLLDTCVVLSLYATRRLEEILHANPGPFLIAEAVLRESLYIYVDVDGAPEKERIPLEQFLESGVLSVIEPQSDGEFQALIDLSLKLDEGEAMTCALALHRGYRIATDEKKTIKLIGSQVSIVGTLDMVREWAGAASVPQAMMREVLAAIENRGYVPGADYSWWKQVR